MPIDESELDTHFIRIDANATVDTLRRHLTESTGEARYSNKSRGDAAHAILQPVWVSGRRRGEFLPQVWPTDAGARLRTRPGA
jgi:hypothetical protein